MTAPLPPGQFELPAMPRFGLLQHAHRFPRVLDGAPLRVTGQVRAPVDLGPHLATFPRVEQTSDFHCVTSWSVRGQRWGGWRLRDLFDAFVEPLPAAKVALLRGQDGARTCLPLEDLLGADVLVADRLGGEPLPIAHGAPWRLVAPAHYGYKSVKHLSAIELGTGESDWRLPSPRFMDHPRGRVALEERGRGLPGWLLRWLYRPSIGPASRYFARALAQRKA